MSTPRAILESMDVAGFVPGRYRDFRPVIAEAIAFFVGRLPPPRFERILASQAALPADAPRSLRLVTLLGDCPVLHKLAQVVSRHQDLDAGLRHRLQRLEMDEPRTPWSELEPHLTAGLDGAADEFAVEIEPAPLAEASVAVVVPCRWRPPPDGPARDGVLKIIKPGVADHLDEELEILVPLADHLDEQRDACGLPTFDHRATFATVGDLLRHEVQPEVEQRNLAAAAGLYAGDARVQVPAVLPFSTPEVTAMERVHGSRVTDARGSTARRMAETVIRAVAATPVFATGSTVMFHADPHAGNLFATDDGRLAMLDWSLVGHLDKRARATMAALALAALRQDHAGVIEAILATVVREPARGALCELVSGALGELRRGRLAGPGWLVDLLDGAVARGASFPADLMLFRKMLFTLRGVVADIDPDCSTDAVFLAAAMRTLVAEWPRRMLTHPFSRDFGTHLSTADLMAACIAAPATLMAAPFAEWGCNIRASPRVTRPDAIRRPPTAHRSPPGFES